MKTRQLHYSAKLRQYRYLAKRIDRAVRDGSFALLSQNRRQMLVRKLKERLRRLSPILSEHKLKNALAGFAMLLATGAGAQSFAPPVDSPFGLAEVNTLSFPNFVDIDDDGDQDYFELRYIDEPGEYSRIMVFTENTGTPDAPAFSAANEVTNPFGIDLQADPDTETTTAAFGDLDNDGDYDLMLGMSYSDSKEIRYFENTGTPTAPTFAAPQINPFGLDSSLDYNLPALADLDADGDLDLYVTGEYGTQLYFENTGTPEAPAFSAGVANPFGISLPFEPEGYAQFPALADFDLDGDYDLLIGELREDYDEYYHVSLVYFENEGTTQAPAFGTAQAFPFGLQDVLTFPGSLAATDIDSDGDVDIFVTDFDYDADAGQIVFFENLDNPSSVVGNDLDAEVNLMPNPVSEYFQLNIASDEILTNPQFEIHDVYGKKLQSGIIGENGFIFIEKVDVHDFSAGVYFVKIYSEGKSKTIRFLKE